MELSSDIYCHGCKTLKTSSEFMVMELKEFLKSLKLVIIVVKDLAKNERDLQK
jgi:hypothetical protein